MIIGYERALLAPHTEATAKNGSSNSIDEILREAMKRRWRQLAEERIEDVSPTIPLGRRFWPLSREKRTAINDLFTHPEVQTLMTHLSCDSDQAKVKVLDAAYWMKGCSSLGRLRFAVLISVGPKGKQRFALIDIKEAVQAAALSAKRLSKQEDFAPRAVM
jgi:uncharacterized protein (DUF2252 family)